MNRRRIGRAAPGTQSRLEVVAMPRHTFDPKRLTYKETCRFRGAEFDGDRGVSAALRA
jgi:hypothetical protein